MRDVIESKPPTSLRAPVVGIRFEVDPANRRARPATAAIEALLATVSPDAVRLLEIPPDSQLDRVPHAAARFTKLTHAHVSGRKLRDYSSLAELRDLESLFITYYREPRLFPTSARNLMSFRSIRDQLETCSLSSDELWFQTSKLQRFEGGKVRKLQLEGCRALDHESIRSLEGVEELQLMNQPVTNLDFLDGLPKLRHLDYYSGIKGVDFGALLRTRGLRVSLSGPDKLVAELGRANPRLSISSGSACFIGGEPARHFGDFYPELPAQPKQKKPASKPKT